MDRARLCLFLAFSLLLSISITSCSNDKSSSPPGDSTAPDPVSDLRVASSGADGVVLAWTASGDDGTSGRAAQYDIRYSAAPIESASWGGAVRVSYPGLPSPAGVTERIPVTGLPEGSWYFAVVVADEVPNWSGFSNVASGYVGDTASPAAITDLLATTQSATEVRLEWTATGNDGVEGTASEYDLRWSLTPLNAEAWESGTRVSNVPAPAEAGTEESFLVGGFTSGHTYHFAIRAADTRPNWSGLSNLVSATPGLDTGPPATVTDLVAGETTGRTVVVTWTAPGDDGNEGLADRYDLRRSDAPIDLSNWDAAIPLGDLPVPARPGTAESYTASGLDPLTSYHFALRTADEVESWSDVSNDISVTTGDSWPLTRSPDGSFGAAGPDWSPDGTRVAFSASWGGSSDVYVVAADGGDPIRLTDDPARDATPSWSPDGTRIAFTSDRGREHQAIWVMEAVPGAEPVLVASHADTIHLGSPDWSPDGTRIMYQRGVFGTIFSPFDIWTVPAQGGESERIVAAGEDWGCFGPKWSPDGTRIALMSSLAFSQDIFVVPLDGGVWSRLTYSTLSFANHSPAWSPDGERIAFTSTRGGTPGIYLVPTDGTTATRLTEGAANYYSPAWAPSGDRIAYSSDRSGLYEIWVQLVQGPG